MVNKDGHITTTTTTGTRTAHTSAKAADPLVKIPLKFLDPDRDPDHHQNLISCCQLHHSRIFHQNSSTIFWVILLTATHTHTKAKHSHLVGVPSFFIHRNMWQQ